jgi:hypothetical protein
MNCAITARPEASFSERGLVKSVGAYRLLSDNIVSKTEDFSPPWPSARSLGLGECDMANFHCSLLETLYCPIFPIISKSGLSQGVSVVSAAASQKILSAFKMPDKHPWDPILCATAGTPWGKNGRSVQCYFPEPQGFLNLIFTGFWRHQPFRATDFAYGTAADGMAG